MYSTQKEADTILIPHVSNAASKGAVVHIVPPGTDVFILALRRQTSLGSDVCVIIGNKDKPRLLRYRTIDLSKN